MVAGGLAIVLAVLLAIGAVLAVVASFEAIEGMRAPTPEHLRESTRTAGYLFLAALASGAIGIVVLVLAWARARSIAARDEAEAVESAEWR